MDRELIEHYAAGGEKLSLAIRGLTREDLLCRPADADANVGKWSIQQVVIHCMDSELVSTDRMKRMIAEDNPTLIGYDENKFVAEPVLRRAVGRGRGADRRPEPQARSPTCCASCPTPRSDAHGHAQRARHASRSARTSKAVVEHLDHHLKFIHAKRATMGKEMW